MNIHIQTTIVVHQWIRSLYPNWLMTAIRVVSYLISISSFIIPHDLQIAFFILLPNGKARTRIISVDVPRNVFQMYFGTYTLSFQLLAYIHCSQSGLFIWKKKEMKEYKNICMEMMHREWEREWARTHFSQTIANLFACM